MSLADEVRQHEHDTGSPEVQIALITEDIETVVAHLKKNKKDDSARRGLLKMVGKRRRLLGYLERTNYVRYQAILDVIGLKR